MLLEMRKQSADSAAPMLNTETDLKMDKLHGNIETLESKLQEMRHENESLRQTLVRVE